MLFLFLQLFRGAYPETREENPMDLHQSVQVSQEVSGLLRRACYDCHSMETRFPWYSQMAPVSWSIFEHIEHGRGELNFSEWGTLSTRKKLGKLDELIEELAEDEMPLKSYRLFHSEARLTDEEKRAIIVWAKETSNQLLN